jgi:hypothetical protein
MTGNLGRRIERLERGFHAGHDIDRARAIVHAYRVVRYNPEQATDEDRALAAVTSNEEWQRAFVIVLDAAGGLSAVLGRIEAERLSEPNWTRSSLTP